MKANQNAGSAVSLSDEEVWEAFRTVALDGDDLYVQLRRYLTESGFFDQPGDTLEVGAGDGALWRADGESLLDLAASKGRVVLTDADAACVEKCRTLRRSRAVVDTAECDAQRVPYPDATFARVLAVQVLHWCSGTDGIRTAVHELARVARQDSRVVVVTVDAHVHMVELYSLMHQAKERMTSEGLRFDVEVPRHPPRIAGFCATNAGEYLRASFGAMRRVDVRYAHRIERAHPALPLAGDHLVAKYVESAPFLRQSGEDDDSKRAFLKAVRGLVSDAIARHGAFRMSRCDVIYDCTEPQHR